MPWGSEEGSSWVMLPCTTAPNWFSTSKRSLALGAGIVAGGSG